MLRSLRGPFALLTLTAALIACDSDASNPSGAGALTVLTDGSPVASGGLVVFAETAVGASATKTFTLRNAGDAALTLTGTPPVRLERDNRLAFQVAPPASPSVPAGGEALFAVTFAPRAPGDTVARLVIAHDGADSPAIIALSGLAVNAGDGNLLLLADDVPVGASLALRDTPVGETGHTTLTLQNVGPATLNLTGATPLAIAGADAAAFSVDPLAPSSVGPGTSANVSLTFAPDRCGVHRAELVIATDGARPTITIDLTGRGVAGVTEVVAAADRSLVSTPTAQLAMSADGARVAIGNAAANAFNGAVIVYDHDGCAVTPVTTITSGTANLGAALFGQTVNLSADGEQLLATAQDGTRAWIFDVPPTARAGGPTAALGGAPGGTGRGRSAALSGDAAVAALGAPAVDSGFNEHGAVHVYARPGSAWRDLPGPTARLRPDERSTSFAVGRTVGVSHDGALIAASGLRRNVNREDTLAAWLFERDGAGGSWGVDAGDAEDDLARSESVILEPASPDPAGDAAEVILAGDGETLLLTAPQPGGSVTIYVFVRGDDGWGRPGPSSRVRHETARLRSTGDASWRAAMSADGGVIIGAGGGGTRELTRPATGWTDSVAESRSWPVTAFGAVAISAGGATFGTIDREGTLSLVLR